MDENIEPPWCECPDKGNIQVIFYEDGQHVCGIHKHHYHCIECKGVVQIG